MLAEVSEGSTGEVGNAVEAARKAATGWAKAGGHARAKVLYALARILQMELYLRLIVKVLLWIHFLLRGMDFSSKLLGKVGK